MRNSRDDYDDSTKRQNGVLVSRVNRYDRYALWQRAWLLVLLLPGCSCQLYAQKITSTRPQQLPAAEKLVDSYLKAIGGKKRVGLIRDATYEWTISLQDQPMGTVRTRIKAPGAVRMEMTFGNGQIISAANTSSAWVQGLDGQLRTLTGQEAATTKLQALLEASHLLGYKKLNILARVVSLGDLASQPAYIVEFSTRSGALLRYWFNANSKLLVKIEDEAGKTTTRFADYRWEGKSEEVLEPHQVGLNTGAAAELTLLLQHASYNTGIADKSFDQPHPLQR